jgi:hypothetical protein
MAGRFRSPQRKRKDSLFRKNGRQFMVLLNPIDLAVELGRLRKMPAQDGTKEPPGVWWLRTLLDSSTDLKGRSTVYGLLIAELKIQNDLSGALDCARNRLVEFDDIVSRAVFARVLLDMGRAPDAVIEFKTAFDIAARNKVLVNYTFGELMRAAVIAKDIDTMHTISKRFLALRQRVSTNDCRLETDWMDAAEALGSNPQLMAKLRRRAVAKQT